MKPAKYIEFTITTKLAAILIVTPKMLVLNDAL